VADLKGDLIIVALIEESKKKVWRSRARWQIRSIYCFDSVKEKSQVTQEKLYSKEKKEKKSTRNHERGGRTAETMWKLR
jgi:DNA-directed RNA polymerase delta subunit